MSSAKMKGQTTLEVVILIGFVVAALIAMGVYMKRGVQGRLRESTDQVGEQYSALNVESEYTTDTKTVQHESKKTKGEVTTEIFTNEQKKGGYEKLKGFQKVE